MATAIGSAGAFTLTGSTFGIDFNPVSGGLRVVSDTGTNLRLNASTGTLISTDTKLGFAVGDANFGATPNVVAVAYSNSFSGATMTSLYGIDTNLDALVLQNPPDGGQLTTIGKLGLDVNNVASFDIAPNGVTGLAVLTTGKTSALYSINLSTGAATLVGNLGNVPGVVGALAVLAPNITVSLSGNTATFTGSPNNDAITLDVAGGLLRHNLFTGGAAGFNSDFDFDSLTAGDQTFAFGTGAGVIVNSGAGNDSIVIGSSASAGTILGGQVTIDGGQGTDSVTLHASADSTGRTINLTDTQLTIPTTNTAINFSGTESLRVNTGSGADTVTVASTATGVNTTIDDSAGGAGVVRVGTSVTGGIDTLHNLRGGLTLLGGSGNNQLFIDNSGAGVGVGTSVFQIKAGEVQLVGRTTVSFSSFESLDVSGGAGRESFQVTPDANLAITINGGGPLGGNAGDSLTVNRSGTTNAKLTATPSASGFSGTWTFTGLQTINFNGIERVTPASRIAIGADAGGGPHVRIFDSETGVEQFSFFAFDGNFRGGVRVALGDVNNDGTSDIIAAAGAGGGPHVKIFDGVTGQLQHEFFAFAASFLGGVNVACGDVNGDGFADVIVVAGASGGPHVKVFSGANGSLIREFFAYNANFKGGVSVATGDVNGDGSVDVITGAGPGGGPHVRVFSGIGNTVLSEFFAFGAGFTGGVTVAAADIDNDGRADIITGAGAGGGPHVRVFSGLNGTALRSFFAFDGSFNGGVRVGASDVNGDGVSDLFVGSGAGPLDSRLRVFDGLNSSQVGNDNLAFGGFRGGVFVGGF